MSAIVLWERCHSWSYSCSVARLCLWEWLHRPHQKLMRKWFDTYAMTGLALPVVRICWIMLRFSYLLLLVISYDWIRIAWLRLRSTPWLQVLRKVPSPPLIEAAWELIHAEPLFQLILHPACIASASSHRPFTFNCWRLRMVNLIQFVNVLMLQKFTCSM